MTQDNVQAGESDARATETESVSAAQSSTESADTAPTRSETLPKDVLFELLSSERRRVALKFLDRTDGETTLSDLAEYIASVENDKPVRELTSAERKRVYISLYQGHLPKLDDADVVEYNQARGRIELRERAAELYAHLEIDADLSEEPDSATSRGAQSLFSGPVEAIRDRIGGS